MAAVEYRPSYPVRTRRLLLRPFEAGDVDAVHAYQSREDVCRYIPYHPRSRDEVLERIAGPDRHDVVVGEGQALLLAVVEAASGVLVGDVMLALTSTTHRCGEIGYVISPDHADRGIATEAAAALLAMAFDGMRLHRVIGRVDARNGASAAVLRGIGMRQEARLRENEWFKGEWSDELDFAILAAEWHEFNARAAPVPGRR